MSRKQVSFHVPVLVVQLIIISALNRPAYGNSIILKTIEQLDLHRPTITHTEIHTDKSVKETIPLFHATKNEIQPYQNLENDEAAKTVNQISIRHKRSPYPPGYISWSGPSEPLPCNCSPGGRKCRCLGILERLIGAGKIPIVFRKRKQAVKY